MTTAILYQKLKRYNTLFTDRISSLPVAVLMPHSGCNCRCVMCDIWKGNGRTKQLSREDISGLLQSFKKWQTKEVLMSGGEALLHPLFFDFCAILKKEGIRITLLSTGISVKQHAENLAKSVDEIIISLDGNAALHNQVRNIPLAFEKLEAAIQTLHSINSSFPVRARTVIHRLNFRIWPEIVETAKQLELISISFLPADVSSHAFNREYSWEKDRQMEIVPSIEEIPLLEHKIEELITTYGKEIDDRFIVESRDKLKKIAAYYRAFHGLNEYPYKKCNAPWVSTVIEADGSVRPCFFHESLGNIHTDNLDDILNGKKAIQWRKSLDMEKNETCKKCVCYLHLSPGTMLT